MGKHIKNAMTDLLRREERILGKIAEMDPALAEELRAVKAGIAAVQTPPDRTYAGHRRTTDAVRACLERAAQFMEKRQVADDLIRGGFLIDPVNGPRLIVEVIKKQIQRGTFAEDWDGKVGLQEFANPKPMTDQRKEYLRTRKSKGPERP